MGRKTVCLDDVLMTAHFELGADEVEVFCAAPCSEVDSSGTSRIYQQRRGKRGCVSADRPSPSPSPSPVPSSASSNRPSSDPPGTHLDDVADQVRQDLVLFDLLRILGDLFLHLVLLVQEPEVLLTHHLWEA